MLAPLVPLWPPLPTDWLGSLSFDGLYLDWPCQQACGKPVSIPLKPDRPWNCHRVLMVGGPLSNRSSSDSELDQEGDPSVIPCSPCGADSGMLNPHIQATSWFLLAIACCISHTSRYGR